MNFLGKHGICMLLKGVIYGHKICLKFIVVNSIAEGGSNAVNQIKVLERTSLDVTTNANRHYQKSDYSAI